MLKPNIEFEDFLTPAEREEFSEKMHIVRSGIEHFVEAGQALTVIRDKRLYREKYSTFEQFCTVEFGMSKSYAHRLIHGFDTIRELADTVPTVPANERVARELNKVPKPIRKDVWNRALALSNKPTSATVQEAKMDFVPVEDKLDPVLNNLRTAAKLLDTAPDISHSPINVIEECMRLVKTILSKMRHLLIAIVMQRAKD